MKKLLTILFAVILVVGTATLVTAGVANTPHDVQIIRGTTGLEPCAMCHTPHSGTGDYPLWNRQQDAQSYTLYDSPTFDMQAAADLQAPSTLCMVCHNGATSQLVNYPGPRSTENTNYNMVGGELVFPWTDLTTDMRNDHPVSFTYDPALDDVVDNNGFPAATTDGTTGRKYIEGTGAKYPLYGPNMDQMECSTCHSVHHTVSGYGESMDADCLSGARSGPACSVGTQVYFLRRSNAGSQMCIDCHKNR